MAKSNVEILKINDEILSYNQETGKISITWEDITVTHTAKDWLNADMGNTLLKRDINRHMED